ncbi:unnamed protein product [Protopolystoma xenopodis]|uniref:Uncharacterized protein n=1 Tax=Protopolystoma xenopodis TaxID=117903 RepID=A0A448WKP9_9PLAT|nr:unnamed protein product [Protopolystoma xenopodis]
MKTDLFRCSGKPDISEVSTRRKRNLASNAVSYKLTHPELHRSHKRLKLSDSSSYKENSSSDYDTSNMQRTRRSQRPLAAHNQLDSIQESTPEIYRVPLTRKRSALLSSASHALLRGPRTRLSESARSSPRITPRQKRARRASVDTLPFFEIPINNAIHESDSSMPTHYTRSRKRSATSISSEATTEENNTSTSQPSPSCTIPLASDQIDSWFSPRRFKTIEKDQAAKMKRLNTRRMEFGEDDINGADQSSFMEDSILVSYR